MPFAEQYRICILPRSSGIYLLLLLVLFLLTHSTCFAAEGGSGAYWPGFRNFVAGIVPPKPGLYLRNDIVAYSATAPRVVLNGFPVENVSADIIADIIEPLYVLPHKLFGANHAIVITQPLVWAELSGGIIGTDLEPSGSRFAPGDTIFSPLYLGWHNGNTHFNSNIAIFIPTGDYDITRVSNTTRNYWAIDPEFGFTYLNPKTGWDLSGVLGCTFSLENHATNYRSGNILHLDYAIGRTLKNNVKAGIIGYAQVQVSPNSGEGAIFGSFKSRVYGIGPAVQWRAGIDKFLMVRYLHEFSAQNNLKGNQLALTFKMAF